MRMRVIIAFLLIINVLWPAQVIVQPDSGSIGDVFEARWSVPFPYGKLELSQNMLPEKFGPFEILNQNYAIRNDSIDVFIQFSAYDSAGILTSPQAILKIQSADSVVLDSLTLNPFSILLSSVLTETDTTLRPIKGLHETQFQLDLKLALYVLLGLIVIYLFYRYWKKANFKKNRNHVMEIVPPEKAHIVALRKLEKLALSDILEKGEMKSYISHLTDIAREYIQNRYFINALEMTTSELKRDVHENVHELNKNKNN